MSQIYASAIVAILAQVLPYIGVPIGSDDLTRFVSTLVTIVAGVWVMVRRHQQGDISVVGSRKSGR